MKPTKNHYNTLGVSSNASESEIKHAFRKKAKKLHPDKGGEKKEFQQLNEAYQTLSNPQKRLNYDTYGEAAGHMDNMDEKAQSECVGLVAAAVSQGFDDYKNLIQDCIESVRRSIRTTEKAIAIEKEGIAKFEKAKQRIIKKHGGENVLLASFDNMIANINQSIQRNNADIALKQKMIECLNGYDWVVKEKKKDFGIVDSEMRRMMADSFGF